MMPNYFPGLLKKKKKTSQELSCHKNCNKGSFYAKIDVKIFQKFLYRYKALLLPKMCEKGYGDFETSR